MKPIVKHLLIMIISALLGRMVQKYLYKQYPHLVPYVQPQKYDNTDKTIHIRGGGELSLTEHIIAYLMKDTSFRFCVLGGLGIGLTEIVNSEVGISLVFIKSLIEKKAKKQTAKHVLKLSKGLLNKITSSDIEEIKQLSLIDLPPSDRVRFISLKLSLI